MSHFLNSLLIILCLLLSIPGFSDDSQSTASQVPEGELSLKQDRKELDQLRKDIPEPIKKKNDDLAFILKLFDDKSRSASAIRQQFNRVYNRLRKQKNKEFKKERKSFTRTEKKRRKTFLSAAKKKRKDFLDTKPSTDAKKEFFEEERTDRKVFFSEEREKRRDFESDLRARRKDFDSFLKEKKKDFTERLKQFKKQKKQAEKERKKQARQRRGGTPIVATQPLDPKFRKYLEEFEKIPAGRALPLQPKEEK